jgi:hypothetical protein
MLGTIIVGDLHFYLYQGVNASDGSLMLPSYNKGAALYQSVIWVHRLWKSGRLNINIGDTVLIEDQSYKVVGMSFIEYGIYPKLTSRIQYIATCYSEAGEWVGVQLYEIQSISYQIHSRR